MGAKNNDETVKYNLLCNIKIEGTVSEADIVGALFGQTEGLLDSDMDLKQLQKSGRIGRMQLELKVDSGITKGNLVVPSSLNKVETAILAATLESVDRVGPCACHLSLDRIVDVRKSKRDLIQKRASEIMKKWDIETREKTKSISKTVEKDSKKGRVIIFGTDALPAGPEIYTATDIILVEGRADIINLMEMGINNTIALQGTNVPKTIKTLSKTRTITALLDGDRGGDMILRELAIMGKIEFVARAPYKREVEDLSYNEIMEALENKAPMADAYFITDDLSVAEFLSDSSDESSSEKTTKFTGKNGKKSKKSSSKKESRTFSPKQDSKRSSSKKGERKSHRHRRSDTTKSASPRLFSGRSDSRRSSKSRGSRSSDQDRSRQRRISVPKAILSIIDKTKATFSAVLLGKSNKTIKTVKTSEVYDTLVDTDGV